MEEHRPPLLPPPTSAPQRSTARHSQTQPAAAAAREQTPFSAESAQGQRQHQRLQQGTPRTEPPPQPPPQNPTPLPAPAVPVAASIASVRAAAEPPWAAVDETAGVAVVSSSPNLRVPAGSRSPEVGQRNGPLEEGDPQRHAGRGQRHPQQQGTTERRPEDPGGRLPAAVPYAPSPVPELPAAGSPATTWVAGLPTESADAASQEAPSYANSILSAIADAMGRPAMFIHGIDATQLTEEDAFVLHGLLGSLTAQLDPAVADLQGPEESSSSPWLEWIDVDAGSGQALAETHVEEPVQQQLAASGSGGAENNDANNDDDNNFDVIVYEESLDTGEEDSSIPADEDLPAGMEDAYYDGYVRGHESRVFEYSAEVTAEDYYEHGVDMQGIAWDMLPVTRAEKRTERLLRYANYENLTVSRDDISKEVSAPRNDGEFYRFRYTRLTEKCSFIHFQLRHLLWASSKHDVFYTHANAVKHWNPIAKAWRTVMEVSSAPLAIAPFKISTMCAFEGIIIAGGFCGEYAVTTPHLQSPHQSYLTRDPNGIVNHILIAHPRYSSSATAPTAWASSNDQKIRALDLHTLSVATTMSFPYPINCSSLSPDRRLLAVVGDDTLGLVVGADGKGDVVGNLTGHVDYGFACAWSPDGRTIATGNQDKTARLYDLRYLSKAFKVLPGNMGAIRSLAFSDDGRFLAMAEPADFVHLFDVSSHYTRSQVVDFFGEISGVSFSPIDAECLYIGNADPNYGSILEFERAHPAVHMSNLRF